MRMCMFSFSCYHLDSRVFYCVFCSDYINVLWFHWLSIVMVLNNVCSATFYLHVYLLFCLLFYLHFCLVLQFGKSLVVFAHSYYLCVCYDNCYDNCYVNRVSWKRLFSQCIKLSHEFQVSISVIALAPLKIILLIGKHWVLRNWKVNHSWNRIKLSKLPSLLGLLEKSGHRRKSDFFLQTTGCSSSFSSMVVSLNMISNMRENCNQSYHDQLSFYVLFASHWLSDIYWSENVLCFNEYCFAFCVCMFSLLIGWQDNKSLFPATYEFGYLWVSYKHQEGR